MIRLEHFEQKDFSQLIKWIDSEELLLNWAGSLFSFPLTNSSMEWYLRGTNDRETSDAFVYRVVEEETNEVVGHISLGGISRKNRSARISRVLIGSGEHKGKGYCKQMIAAVIKIGFEELKLHRIALGVYDFNTSALKCYQSAGFKIEGTTRDVLLYKENWWSLVEMAILEDEWRAIYKTS
ncbi:MAG: N-acetyltransferase [Chitinophagaceae bacterium]|nr:MAG: N-acetyltransferase [Chitinophagaceae bacterium]